MFGIFLLKNQLTKSDPTNTGGGKCPASCQLGLSEHARLLETSEYLLITKVSRDK